MKLSEFGKWHPLNNLSVRDVPERANNGFVYVFRQCSTKEILYIGGTTDLRQRLFGNYIGGVGGKTTKRVHDLLFKEGAITDTEVAWREVLDYALEEKQLRYAYFKQKGELPRWNKQL